MSTTIAPLEVSLDTRASARRSFLLVFTCTLIGALAQMFIKTGSAQVAAIGGHVTLTDVAHHPALIVQWALSIISNPRLFVGYMLYGVNTFLIAIALKGRELSRLYPIIALTFVWVTLLSITVLGEHMNFFRVIGIVFIVLGVSILGGKQLAKGSD